MIRAWGTRISGCDYLEMGFQWASVLSWNALNCRHKEMLDIFVFLVLFQYHPKQNGVCLMDIKFIFEFDESEDCLIILIFVHKKLKRTHTNIKVHTNSKIDQMILKLIESKLGLLLMFSSSSFWIFFDFFITLRPLTETLRFY